MGILEELALDETWEEFLQYKTEKKHLSPREQKELTEYVRERSYRPLVNQLKNQDFTFDYPTKKIINKSGTAKKRIVYTFKKDETMVLKVMGYLLYRYDGKMCSSCYSFRKSSCAKEAVRKAVSLPKFSRMYCLKADVSNYFNSIPAVRLCEELEAIIDDDKPLLSFLKKLLLSNLAYEDGKLTEENRGAMAGTPISPFFANIYLRTLDEYYEKKKIAYFRYSDDILIFAPSMEQLEQEQRYLQEYLEERGLRLNPEKVFVSKPNETWEFLGISYRQGKVDLSSVTKLKLKAKIRRKAHGLYRWRKKKEVEYEKAAHSLIRIFNRKFYDEKDENAFTWSRWFFPLLNTDEGLREMDEYFLRYIRYLYSGRHYKGNYRITYDKIKSLGYRSLVNEYYKYLREAKQIRQNKADTEETT